MEVGRCDEKTCALVRVFVRSLRETMKSRVAQLFNVRTIVFVGLLADCCCVLEPRRLGRAKLRRTDELGEDFLCSFNRRNGELRRQVGDQ